MSKQQEIPDEAVPIAAKNAAWLTLAVEMGNDSYIYEDRFMQALDKALLAAAPHMCQQTSLVQTQAARLRATLDERLGRGTPQTTEGDHE